MIKKQCFPYHKWVRECKKEEKKIDLFYLIVLFQLIKYRFFCKMKSKKNIMQKSDNAYIRNIRICINETEILTFCAIKVFCVEKTWVIINKINYFQSFILECIHTQTHRHTHTHIYIYIYINDVYARYINVFLDSFLHVLIINCKKINGITNTVAQFILI